MNATAWALLGKEYYIESLARTLPTWTGAYLWGDGLSSKYFISRSWSTSYICLRPSPKEEPLPCSTSFLKKSLRSSYWEGAGLPFSGLTNHRTEFVTKFRLMNGNMWRNIVWKAYYRKSLRCPRNISISLYYNLYHFITTCSRLTLLWTDREAGSTWGEWSSALLLLLATLTALVALCAVKRGAGTLRRPACAQRAVVVHLRLHGQVAVTPMQTLNWAVLRHINLLFMILRERIG